MSKYAPADENGDKPYVVEVWDFGRHSVRVVYAANPGEAKYRAIGRQRNPMAYAQSVRRATPQDLPAPVSESPLPEGTDR